MALNAYMSLIGSIQGNIKGSVLEPGKEDLIRVIAVSHNIEYQIDSRSGLPSGHRQHMPLTITKEIDIATPRLHEAQTNNEQFSEIVIGFWKLDERGREVQYYTILLEKALISGIEFEMLNNKYPENLEHAEREHVSFSYQKILWTYEDGGITAEDDWASSID